MNVHRHIVDTHLGAVPVTDTQPEGGSGPVLMLLHGFLCDSTFWHHLIEVLPPGLRIVAPDLAAFGRLGTGKREVDFNHLAEVLEALRLAMHITRIQAVAQDLGCLVLLRYTSLYQHHVDRIVWFSPSFYPDQFVPRGLRLWRGRWTGAAMNGILFGQTVKSYFRKASADASPTADACAVAALATYGPPEGRRLLRRWIHWGEPNALFWDHPRMLRNVASPTLVVWGGANPWVHFSQIERLGRHVEDIKIVALTGCGHFPSIDNPERVGREVAGFLGLV
ncbi:MAG: alpha/beta hydrolase [Caldilineaceae bacterium SB0665_bin_21]|nr:alpha/beta hydrolase [Caldilineaceae bacterium SB0665_bin_21]MYA03047.1 alpha/beta hydrolase [Caldilineaceae bacterium SB0664_bin_22]MYC61263.1 alpha/beta hydrolase [Caldilineaceae bacterium SB0661_bin_34]